MRTSAVARELNVSPDLIRRLEARGEIPPVRRDRAGQRRFSSEDVERLRCVIYPVHPRCDVDQRRLTAGAAGSKITSGSL